MNKKQHRGGALITVIIFTSITSILMAAALKWSAHETAMNSRHLLRVEAQNAAESILEHGVMQLNARWLTQTNFDSNELQNNPLTLSSSFRNFLSESTYIDASASGGDVEITAGTIGIPRRIFLDPDDPNNRDDPQEGQWITARNVNIYSRATARDPRGNAVTSYSQVTFQIRSSSGFNKFLNYNMDLELHPGPTMTMSGPIQVNGDTYAVAKENMYFEDKLTMSGEFYVGMKLAPDDWSSLGGESTQSGTHVKIKNPEGNWTDPYKGSGPTNHGDSYNDSRAFDNYSDWVDFASQEYDNNIVTLGKKETIPGVPNYIEDNPYTEADDYDDLNYGYSLIEPNLSNDSPYHKHAGESQKIAYHAGLTFRVHESTDKPKDAGGNEIANAIRLKDADGNDTNTWISAHKIKREASAADIPRGNMPPITNTKEVQAEDAFGNEAYQTDGGMIVYKNQYSTSENDKYIDPYGNYVSIADPSALSEHKITIHEVQEEDVDIDETIARDIFKALPYKEDGDGDPISSFYDERRQEGLDLVQMDMGKFKALIEKTDDESSNFPNSSYDLDQDYNGTVYFEFPQDTSHTPGVDKITRSKDKMGLFLINNKELPDPTYNKSGTGRSRNFSVATNSTVYIKGHFNADGTIEDDSDTEPDDSSNPDIPAVVAGDAVTILSDNWDFSKSKLDEDDRIASDTEFSGAIVCGLMPTDKNGSGEGSGGSHNFPRFLETWKKDGNKRTFAYRGSLVALFESEIATEPWHTGYYGPPARKWGYYAPLGSGGIKFLSGQTFMKLDYKYITRNEWDAL